MTGIEPVSPAWKAGALTVVLHPHVQREGFPLGCGPGRIRTDNRRLAKALLCHWSYGPSFAAARGDSEHIGARCVQDRTQLARDLALPATSLRRTAMGDRGAARHPDWWSWAGVCDLVIADCVCSLRRQPGLFGVTFAGPVLLPMQLAAMPSTAPRLPGAACLRREVPGVLRPSWWQSLSHRAHPGLPEWSCHPLRRHVPWLRA